MAPGHSAAWKKEYELVTTSSHVKDSKTSEELVTLATMRHKVITFGEHEKKGLKRFTKVHEDFVLTRQTAHDAAPLNEEDYGQPAKYVGLLLKEFASAFILVVQQNFQALESEYSQSMLQGELRALDSWRQSAKYEQDEVFAVIERLYDQMSESALMATTDVLDRSYFACEKEFLVTWELVGALGVHVTATPPPSLGLKINALPRHKTEAGEQESTHQQ
ncbi:hypothetical protein HDU89_001394 [Geranomyces variabilis]|nr:hypothetical protein HDU89_001394 [Geranomyces variabilis]